jgi:hypothetical protein
MPGGYKLRIPDAVQRAVARSRASLTRYGCTADPGSSQTLSLIPVLQRTTGVLRCARENTYPV